MRRFLLLMTVIFAFYACENEEKPLQEFLQRIVDKKCESVLLIPLYKGCQGCMFEVLKADNSSTELAIILLYDKKKDVEIFKSQNPEIYSNAQTHSLREFEKFKSLDLNFPNKIYGVQKKDMRIEVVKALRF